MSLIVYDVKKTQNVESPGFDWSPTVLGLPIRIHPQHSLVCICELASLKALAKVKLSWGGAL